MHFNLFPARRVLGVLAIVAGMLAGFFGFMALAQTPGGRESSAATLIGVAVFSTEGTKVGTVSAVSVGDDKQITEIRLTTASRLGLGMRTVAITQGNFMALDGAVVLDLSAAEVDALPVQTILRRGTTA